MENQIPKQNAISSQEHGSFGNVALPHGRANRPDEPPTLNSSTKKPHPKRKKLPHEIPSWVEQGSRHFITINCKNRGRNILLKNDRASRLLESGQFYENTGHWYLWLMVIMPDHIHFIATFDLIEGLKKTVSSWKRYQKKTLGIDWQSDFFEHRLRNQKEFDEKSSYIRMNPVRRNLIPRSDEWNYTLDRTRFESGSVGDVALPKTLKSIGRASLSERAAPQQHGTVSQQERGSAGGVALPKTLKSIGRASLSERAVPQKHGTISQQEHGSVGNVALPNDTTTTGGANRPDEPPTLNRTALRKEKS